MILPPFFVPQVTDLKAKDFIRELENAIVYGMPYLLQDVEEVRDGGPWELGWGWGGGGGRLCRKSVSCASLVLGGRWSVCMCVRSLVVHLVVRRGLSCG